MVQLQCWCGAVSLVSCSCSVGVVQLRWCGAVAVLLVFVYEMILYIIRNSLYAVYQKFVRDGTWSI